MKKITTVALVLGLLTVFAPFAQAQTYVYPITPTPSYVIPSSYGSTSYGSTCITLTYSLELGSSDAYTGGQVTALQQFFNRTGYLSGVTGYFDNGTYGAVINWQRAHGIPLTGTVGPLTRASINAQSCSSYNPTPVVPIPVPTPVIPIQNNCYTVNGVYSCNNCVNSYTNGYSYNTNGYNSNCGNVCNSSYSYNSNCSNCSYNNGYNGYNTYGNSCNGVTLTSVNASYYNSILTLTIHGQGFSYQNNSVQFNGQTISNISSSDGTTLSITVPNTLYSGSYNFTVTNGSGVLSNSLPVTINSSNWYSNNGNNNGNNNSSNGSVVLSSINGPSSVQTGVTNNWNVTVSNNNSYYNNQSVTVNVDWGDNTNTNSQQAYISGGQNLTFNHVYYSSGNYTIRMTATGSNGAYYYQTYTVYVSGNGNNNYYGSTNISYLSPTSGRIGTNIQIQGSGFSSYGNTVHFGNGGSLNVSSYNGSTINYTVPSQVSGCDLNTAGSYCAQYVQSVTPSSYPIYVTNSSGQSSNTMYFQVVY